MLSSESEEQMKSLKQIVVYGATGYSGRQVVQELLHRGHTPILAGRDEHALEAIAGEIGGEVSLRLARIDRPQSLRTLVADSAMLMNCAGPFGLTAEPLAAAAVEAGVHYLDFAATEQRTIQTVLHRFDAPARQAGVAVVPAMGFFGALGDMLAQLVGGPLAPLDELTIAYAVAGWVLTPGSQHVRELVGEERFAYVNGQTALRTGPLRFSLFSFPAPIGQVRVVEDFPLGETMMVPRHLATREIHALMTASTVEESPGTPLPETVTPQARPQSTFTIVISAVSGQQERHGFAHGGDIYRITAPIIVEAALRLLDPHFSRTGALAPSEAFEPASFLETLRAWGLSYNTSAFTDSSVTTSQS